MGGCCESVSQQTAPNTIPRVQVHDKYIAVDDNADDNVDDNEETWDQYETLKLSDNDEGTDDETNACLLIPKHKLEVAASVIDLLMDVHSDTDQNVDKNDKNISKEHDEKGEEQKQNSKTDEHKVNINIEINSKNDDNIKNDDVKTNEQQKQQQQNTEINQDKKTNIENITTEADHVRSWLKIDGNNKQAVEILKAELASLLTIRSQKYKEKLKEVYHKTYNVTLLKDIKSVIGKGYTMDIVSGLLMSSAEYDSVLIIECISKMDMLSVADIICCRSVQQLKELCVVYKRKCKFEIKTQLKAFAQNEKKKTLLKVIDAIFDLEKEQKENVDLNTIEEDLSFLLTTKKFKDNKKERLVMIFMANCGKYIKILNEKFEAKSKDNLVRFIDKKLGNKSSVGYFCKIRILYMLDSADYYAQKIKQLGKNEKKIANIFIQRMEIDLNQIKKVWMMKKYGDGKDLKQWIAQKISASNDSCFLQKMLDNCS